MQPEAKGASSRQAAIGLALLVVLAAIGVLYYAWTVFILTQIGAAIMKRAPTRTADAVLALGAVQALVGVALAIGGVRRQRRVEWLYAIWVGLLLGIAILERARGAHFNSVGVAAAYALGALIACGAGWVLATTPSGSGVTWRGG